MAGPRPPVSVRVAPAPPPTRAWSATSVEQFITCPLRYWWQRVERWETPSTPPLVIGRAVHGALERLLALPASERVPAAGDVYLAESLVESIAEVEGQGLDAETITEGSVKAMAAYWQTEDPTSVDVAPDGLERKVETDLEGLPFIGHVDRIATSDVGLRVTDYKTGAPKPKYWWGYWRQQLLYAEALRRLGEPVAEVELLYLKDPRAVTRPVYPAASTRAINELGQAHEQRATMAEQGEWEARPQPLCNYCDFKTACPAQRRDAPPPGTDRSNEILQRLGLTQRPIDLPDPGRPQRKAAPEAGDDPASTLFDMAEDPP